MNKLSYKINKEAVLYTSTKKDEGFQVVINNNLASRWFFNIEELEKSLKSDGFYGIFDGPCFLKGCCGVYVEVVHDNDKVIWKRFLEQTDGIRVSNESIHMTDGNDAYEVQDLFVNEDKREHPPLVFSKVEYESFVKKLKDDSS